MRILVTGAGGMLGRDVVRAARDAGHEVVGHTRAELDITDESAVRSAIDAAAPDAIVNCAAWTDVDGAESDEAAALRVNGDAAGHVARAAAQGGARVVHASTDYVFDGTKRTPYVESDPVSPASAYGRTKLAGERAVLAASGEHLIARTAWLFGAGGRNFVATMLQLARERDEVRVVTDQVGCPTYTGHLAPALVRLAERGEPGVHHLAASGSCSWHELAAAAIGTSGIECRVLPTTTAEFPRPAPRPAYSVLASERPGAVALPPWQDGLEAYLGEVAATH